MSINDEFAEVVESFNLVETREAKWVGYFNTIVVIRLATVSGVVVAISTFHWPRKKNTLSLWGPAKPDSPRAKALADLIAQVEAAAERGEIFLASEKIT